MGQLTAKQKKELQDAVNGMSEIVNTIISIREDLEDKRDNMSESALNGEKGEELSELIANLESVSDEVETAKDSLDDLLAGQQ